MKRGAKVRLAAAVCLGLVLSAADRSHSMMLPLSLEQLVSGASAIVRGTVVAQDSHWNEAGNQIVTDVTLSVAEAIDGEVPRQTVLRVTGGTVGGVGLVTSVDATFHDDEEVIVFLDTSQEPAAVVGFHQGKFTVVEGAVEHDGRRRSVDRFVEEIRQHAEGRS